MKKNHLIFRIVLIMFVSSLTFIGEVQAATAKKDTKTILILPFQINSSNDLAYISNGMTRMLHSRLSWHKNVIVVPENQIKNHLSDIEYLSRSKQIKEIARRTHSDFILAGSITEIGGSFSIDVKVYDLKNKRYMAFFEQSKKIDALISKTDRIAATINKKVFYRTTATWKKMEQEKQAYINELKRRNPEYMMESPQWQDTDQAPGWKIWKYLF